MVAVMDTVSTAHAMNHYMLYYKIYRTEELLKHYLIFYTLMNTET